MFFRKKMWNEKKTWCRSIVFWYHMKFWIFSPGFGLAIWAWQVQQLCTLALIMLELYLGENIHNFSWCFLKTTLEHHGKKFPNCFFSFLYLERLTVLCSVPLLFLQVRMNENKSLKFENEGKIIGTRTLEVRNLNRV